MASDPHLDIALRARKTRLDKYGKDARLERTPQSRQSITPNPPGNQDRIQHTHATAALCLRDRDIKRRRVEKFHHCCLLHCTAQRLVSQDPREVNQGSRWACAGDSLPLGQLLVRGVSATPSPDPINLAPRLTRNDHVNHNWLGGPHAPECGCTEM